MIHNAVTQVFSDPGARTPDLRGTLSTSQMGDRIVVALG
jgi:isocitrate/isopropylmalate dehydrogenase